MGSIPDGCIVHDKERPGGKVFEKRQGLCRRTEPARLARDGHEKLLQYLCTETDPVLVDELFEKPTSDISSWALSLVEGIDEHIRIHKGRAYVSAHKDLHVLGTQGRLQQHPERGLTSGATEPSAERAVRSPGWPDSPRTSWLTLVCRSSAKRRACNKRLSSMARVRFGTVYSTY